MDAELVSILQNIQSLAQQATQMQGGEAQKADDEEKVAPAGDLPPEVAEKVLKYLKEMDSDEEDDVEKSDDEDEDDVEKSAEGPNANDTAEARIDEGAGDADEKNINAVAKAIAKMLVKKSAKRGVTKSVDPTKELFKVVKSLAEELKVQKEFNLNVLKGLGIADSILESNKQTAPKAKPMDVSASEVAKSLEFIKQALGTKQEAPVAENGQGHFLAKSLSDGDGALLTALWGKSKKK